MTVSRTPPFSSVAYDLMQKIVSAKQEAEDIKYREYLDPKKLFIDIKKIMLDLKLLNFEKENISKDVYEKFTILAASEGFIVYADGMFDGTYKINMRFERYD